jgi:hypothetical protein
MLTASVTACQPRRTELVTAGCARTQRFPEPSVTPSAKPFPKLDVVGSNPLARFVTLGDRSCQGASILCPVQPLRRSSRPSDPPPSCQERTAFDSASLP